MRANASRDVTLGWTIQFGHIPQRYACTMYNMRQEDKSTVEESIGSDRSLFTDRKLLVVSNRQPYRHEKPGDELSVDRPTGGLTASLDPMMQQTGGTWIAWGDGDADREVVDDTQCVEVPPENPQYTLQRVWLADEQVEGYYYGFSNQVLWPICHCSLATVQSKPAFWEQYRRTNEQFAETVSEKADDRSVIWLHDYHLGLAPQRIRDTLGDEPIIMHFWHIPWPDWDVFRACPHAQELLQGLLGNDALGFHTERYAENFLDCVDNGLPDATIDWQSEAVSYRGGLTRIEVIPMGVPFDEIQQTVTAQQQPKFRPIRESLGIDTDTTLAVGVDRLDYSKGIPERLRALECLLEEYPEWRGSLTYIQKGTESRSEIEAYQSLQAEVAAETARINDRFGTDEWQPIVHVDEYLSEQELYSLYHQADIGIVSPIRDGLNLVAAEYAAAQTDGDGVLVLSTEAGLHDLLGEHVVSVTPYEIDDFAEGLNEALTMPFAERRIHMKQIRRTVAVNDLQTWLGKNASIAQAVGHTHRQTVSND